MFHELDDDLEFDLALTELLRLGEQEADQLTRSFRTPIPSCERTKNSEKQHKPSAEDALISFS